MVKRQLDRKRQPKQPNNGDVTYFGLMKLEKKYSSVLKRGSEDEVNDIKKVLDDLWDRYYKQNRKKA